MKNYITLYFFLFCLVLQSEPKILQHEIPDEILYGKILSEDFEKTLANYFQKRQKIKNFNQYSLDLLMAFGDGYNMDASENFEGILEDIDEKEISQLAKYFFDSSNKYQLVIKGKKFRIS